MMLRAFKAGENAVPQVALNSALRSSNRVAVERAAIGPALKAMERSLDNEAEALLHQCYAACGQATWNNTLRRASTIRAAASGAPFISTGEFGFNAVSSTSVEWAQQHAARLVVGVSRESEAAIRATIVRAQQTQIGWQQAAVLIRQSVGLTEPHANAVINARTRLLSSPGNIVYVGKQRIRVPPAGLPAARLDSILTRYSTQLRNLRAETIAVNESITAANMGQQESWRQLVEQGVLTGQEVEEWLVSDPCPICAPHEGERTRINRPFPSGVRFPLHVRCRCTSGLVNAKPTRRKIGPTSLPEIESPEVSPIEQFAGTFHMSDVGQGEVFLNRFKGWAGVETSRLRDEYHGLRNVKVKEILFHKEHEVPDYSGHANGLYSSQVDRLQVANIVQRAHHKDDLLVGTGSWSVGSDSPKTTYRHELGHHYHYERLGLKHAGGFMRSRRGRSWAPVTTPTGPVGEWRAIWQSMGKAEIHAKVSQYAATNERELFAESFAAYTHPDYGTVALKERWSSLLGRTEMVPVGEPRFLPPNIHAFMEKHVGVRVGTTARVVTPPPPPPGVTTPTPVTTLPPKTGKVRLTSVQVDDIVKRKLAGESATKIAKDYGINPNYVHQLVKKHGTGVTPPTPPPTGPPTPPPAGPGVVKTVVTADIVREIRRLRASGVAIQQIARQFNLSPTFIYKVVAKQVWKTVA